MNTALLSALPIVIGHRGHPGRAPENTLASFAIGCTFADMLEVDVRATADGVVVVHHDDALGRNVTGFPSAGAAEWPLVNSLTFQELSQWDAGGWFHAGESDLRIPSLEMTLDAVCGRGRGLMIEIKDGTCIDALVQIVEAARGRWPDAEIVVASIQVDWVRAFAEKTKAAPVCVMYLAREETSAADIASFAEFASFIIFRTEDPGREHVELAHAAGLKVFQNTNTVACMREAFALGHDGVISDYPDRVRDVVDGVPLVAIEAEDMGVTLPSGWWSERGDKTGLLMKLSGAEDLILSSESTEAATLSFEVSAEASRGLLTITGTPKSGSYEISFDGNDPVAVHAWRQSSARIDVPFVGPIRAGHHTISVQRIEGAAEGELRLDVLHLR